jgi:hypothetical protein
MRTTNLNGTAVALAADPDRLLALSASLKPPGSIWISRSDSARGWVGSRADLIPPPAAVGARGAHLHLIGIAPGDLGVGHEIAAAHLGVELAAANPWTNSTSPTGRISTGPSGRYMALVSMNTVERTLWLQFAGMTVTC